jgi:hypothetical protein
MKRRAIIMAMALGLAACGGDDDGTPTGPSTSGPIVFTSQLSAQNEVPAVTNAEANARGTATITFNVPRDSAGNITGGGSVTFSVQLNGFPAGSAAILAHIHTGASGVAGPVFVNTGLSAAAPIVLNDGTGSISITVTTLTQDQATQVTNNPAGFYFNVHTPVNPGGAVRGQLVRQ